MKLTFVIPSLLMGSWLTSSLLLSAESQVAGERSRGELAMKSLPEAKFSFQGVVGERIAANIDGWLLAAPSTNPGLLEMFRVRDRHPTPQLVPWAGEFAGKYLLSCVAALRQSEREDLRQHVVQFVTALCATQAEDGYLGPFPKSRRLLGEWDLWGHYHVMLGLLAWDDCAGSKEAVNTVNKAAELICQIYLDTPRRVLDAGSDEMNLAISHVMAMLYRRSGNERWLALVRKIEKEWEQAGDYLRTGEKGVAFYQTPRPRWESLHDLQTLFELWQITGEPRYKQAFSQHWQSIQQFDIRNSGAFSGGEQATGNAFAPTAIETCCTVAWMAMSLDMLRLTGRAEVAEALELATLNGAIGAQHPTGRWWTYSTPMDGDRKSSAHEIVFQARAGTPELNCCSVNGPRSHGMLCDWAVMREEKGVALQTHLPMNVTTTFEGKPVTLRCDSAYPQSGSIRWHISAPEHCQVRFRIPSWATGTKASHNGQSHEAKAGEYLALQGPWQADQPVSLELPMKVRSFAGQREQTGRVSLYRGPLLLAWDQHDNTHDEFRIPSLTREQLEHAQSLSPAAHSSPDFLSLGSVRPWLMLEATGNKGTVKLRDFATAGMNGTRYRSWLRVSSTTSQASISPPILSALTEGKNTNGTDDKLAFAVPEGAFANDYSVSLRVRLDAEPKGKLGQLFCTWCAAGDDPLRLVMDGGQLFARIEGSGGAGTEGFRLSKGEWHHLAAVKSGDVLTLFVDGAIVGQAAAPARLNTKAAGFALGGNPLFTQQSEHVAATFKNLQLWTRGLSDEEVETLNARETEAR